MTSPQSLSAPGTGRAHGAAIVGVDGHLVEAEAVISNGPPAFSIAGLPETSVRETRDRIRAAILNSGQPWPAGSITVNLLPASLPKHGTGLDLAVAVAVLTAAAAVPASAADQVRLCRRAWPGRQPAPSPRRRARPDRGSQRRI